MKPMNFLKYEKGHFSKKKTFWNMSKFKYINLRDLFHLLQVAPIN